ncbi:hypothetical protein [Desulfuromonas sp. TF]|uniref:hypothetical protein n=1 Tax=Desulfuromonas sp. TF TaxID=1232410 RepID=UPI0012DCDAF6|nr:hypothetical protein [Desulfuromonas sp. TF]
MMWFFIVLIGLIFLAGLGYVVRAILMQIRLSDPESRARADLLMDRYREGEITPDEYRERRKDID